MSEGLVAEDSVFGIPRIKPMLAETARQPFDHEDWCFEIKWDGYRALAYVSGDQTYIDSRNGKPLLPVFPGLSTLNGNVRVRSILLDGEIAAFRDGKADFAYLRSSPEQAVFVAFDVLHCEGENMWSRPLEERKKLLGETVKAGGSVVVSEAFPGVGRTLFQWVCSMGMEGVLAKHRNSKYFPGKRSRYWLKIKNLQEDTFWVVGYLPSPGQRIGSLVIARKEGAEFTIVGRVSSGLDQEYGETLLSLLTPTRGGLARDEKALFVGSLPPKDRENLTWVHPHYGVQVTFTETTPDGRLRHPVLKDLV